MRPEINDITPQIMDNIYRMELSAYMMRAFRVLEPSTPLEWTWHLDCISEHLMASYRGEISRLIINIPPRCLKSVSVAQIFPSWVLGNQPSTQFIGASYAHSLAERNVMACRRIMQSDWYLDLFSTRISADQNQKDYFTTTESGQYKGTGIGGTITGFGCNYLLIDDPQNPNEAASPTVRNSTNMEIRQTLFSRFNDKRVGRLVMIMQRLHDDDATGNLARDGGYTVVKLPAETRTNILISLGDKKWEMNADDILTPRLPRNVLDELRIDLQEAAYAGQYLQEPIPIGGGEFKQDWYQTYDPRTKKKFGNVYILCDPSGGEEMNKKKKRTSDWSAFMVVETAEDNNYYLLDIVRDRLNPTERGDTLFQLHRKWNAITGKPPKVGYERYGMMSDIHYIKKKQEEESYRFPLIELGGQMIKEERIRRLLPDMQRGRWWFPSEMIFIDSDGRRFDLVKELLYGEMPTFPKARFDDMLDALSRIYDKEMGVVFPKTKVGVSRQADSREISWVDW